MASGKTAVETVGERGEEALIRHLVLGLEQGSSVLTGPGDDCAVVDSGGEKWTLLKTDSMVQGVHFSPDMDPVLVGRKAMNRAISDIAAMGGLPNYALVAISLHAEIPVAAVAGWYAGLRDAAREWDVSIVGGETTQLPSAGAVITISLHGQVEPDHCVLRSGARPGDVVAVTGRLGGSFASGRHLTFTPRVQEARWLVQNGQPSAMMDLSDGLGSDLPKLANASRVGYRIERSALPCHAGVSIDQAIGEGEDYELLLCFSPQTYEKVSRVWSKAFPELELTAIGEIVGDPRRRTDLPRGWEHYREKKGAL